MSDARWQRLQELFEALLAMPAGARAEWLAANEADAALRAEALALVGHEEVDGALTARLAATSITPNQISSKIHQSMISSPCLWSMVAPATSPTAPSRQATTPTLRRR